MRARTHLVAMVLGAALPAVAALAALAGACTLTTSLSGLSNGPDDVDSGTDAANGVDGATAVPDSGTNVGVDAGLDAGDGAATTTAFHCADHPDALLCADFETGTFNAGWANIDKANGGSLAFGAGRFGRGLATTVPTRGSTVQSTRPYAALETSVNVTPRQTITLAFDMKIESAAGGGVVDFSGIDFHGTFYIVTFRMGNDGVVHVHEYGDPIAPNPSVQNDFPLVVQPAIGSWVHGAMQLSFPTASSAHLVVILDGTTAYDGAIGASPYASQPSVYAGINNAESAGQARTIDFDDILVTTP